MNSVCDVPNVSFTGIDGAGKPLLDFSKADEFFKQLKQAGYTRLFTRMAAWCVNCMTTVIPIGNSVHGWEKKRANRIKEILKIVWAR